MFAMESIELSVKEHKFLMANDQLFFTCKCSSPLGAPATTGILLLKD